MWFFIPIGIWLLLVVLLAWIIPYEEVFKTSIAVLTVCMLVSSGLILGLVDIPNLHYSADIPDGTCIRCKIQTSDKFYAVGCDNKTYELKMLDWVNLNTDVCK